MRQIVLDTETTGLEVAQQHRVIEIGCVELLNRRLTGNNFHHYLNPERLIDPGASEVHGIRDADLVDKPLFASLSVEFRRYLEGAELVIHNASFDLGFLDEEFRRAGVTAPLSEVCSITDTLALARRLHPGQKASLDALCKRYGVDNSNRDFHGALLDARLLAEVYLAMTGGQSALSLDSGAQQTTRNGSRWLDALDISGRLPRIVRADAGETDAHRARLAAMRKKADGHRVLWEDEIG
jgi:DNA polymerase-3 subunit epsilon